MPIMEHELVLKKMNEFGLSHVFKFLFLREKIIYVRKLQSCEIPFASYCDCDKGARLHLTKKSALSSISDKVTTTLGFSSFCPF